MKTKLVLLVGLFILAGCAPDGTERKPSKPRGFISYEEIQTITGATTMFGTNNMGGVISINSQ
tara:strand:+ start:773 stop:961 length:189 start_codon:yes stop_codon:yes gene_type:complete